jgi:hypothetical protein
LLGVRRRGYERHNWIILQESLLLQALKHLHVSKEKALKKELCDEI